MKLPRPMQVVAAAMVACTTAYLVGRIVVVGADGAPSDFWRGVYFTAIGLPAVLLVMRAAIDRERRTAWLLIAGGVVCTWLGDLLYDLHDQYLEVWHFPSASDLAYLAGYPLWAAGLLLMAFRHVRGVQRTSVLDGLIAGLAAGALAMVLWLQNIVDGNSGADLRMALTFALLDVLLIVVAVSTLAPQGYRPAPAGIAFVVASLTFAVGDLRYLAATASSLDESTVVADCMWALGLAAYGVGACLPVERRRSRDAPVDEAPGPMVVPVVAALVALGLLVLGVRVEMPDVATGLATAAVALALVRLLWTLQEVRKVNESFRQARTDDLTGLANRRGFLEHVADSLGSGGRSVGVLMIDLDGFKEVNDSLGHPAGDRLLVLVAERLDTEVDGRHLLGRLGGDEFGVTGHFDPDEGADLAGRLAACLDRALRVDGLKVKVSASIGVATSADPADRDELLRRADVAMYDAKRRGRRVSRYHEGIDPHGRERLEMLADLDRDLDLGRFQLHYQPIVEICSGRVVALEGLVRWHHESRGLVLPDEFVPLAEHTGLIPRLTRLVVEQAAEQLSHLDEIGADVTVSVNVSARDLVDEELLDTVVSALRDRDLPAGCLSLEITETALTDDPARTGRTLRALRRAGVRTAIDDFGVGYSSLSKLLELPVSELKLDRSFVSPVDVDRRAQAIVRSTVELARTLGLSVVAEGVETESVLRWLERVGVTRVQGFHLHRPMPAADVLELVRSQLVAPGTAAPDVVATGAVEVDGDR